MPPNATKTKSITNTHVGLAVAFLGAAAVFASIPLSLNKNPRSTLINFSDKNSQYIPTSAEVCDDGQDNDQNSLADCNDLKNCYIINLGNPNVCVGDKGKILLTGPGFGYISTEVLKQDVRAKEIYTSGDHACQVTYKSKCSGIERYTNNQWEADNKVNCATPTVTFTDIGLTPRRSVCEGSELNAKPDPDLPPPPVLAY